MEPTDKNSNEPNDMRDNSAKPNPITQPQQPNLNIHTDNPKPSSNDKAIGIIFAVIGGIGVLGAVFMLIDFYNKVSGSRDIPPYIYLIVPLLFLYSSYYYLSGRNAMRIQNKVNKNLAPKKKKFDKVGLLLTIIIISIIGYVVWYASNISNDNVAYNPETTSEADKAALDEKRTQVANNIAAAEKEYQKNNQGGVKMGLEDLGVNLTDPATGEQYKFAGLLKDPSYSYIDSIHISDFAKCADDDSGYMVETKDENSFAFAIERETMPPICFDFQGVLYL